LVYIGTKMNISRQKKKLIKKSLWIFVGSSVASFISMIIVQYFMGGIQDVSQIIQRSLLIAFGLATIVFVVPSSNQRYPWQ
jgi:hypothetical protein